jgi:glycosyltransferase involved in cell wall biosynthesis
MADDRSVCFVLPSAYGYFSDAVAAAGGGARQLSFVSRHLAAEFDVHFVVGDYGQPKREVHDSVTLHRAYRPSPETPPSRKPIQFGRLFGAMRRADADVYVYRGYPFLATATYLIARTLRSRWVYSIGNDSHVTTDVERLPVALRKTFERALTGAEAVIAQTEVQRELLHERLGVTSTVIPSGYPPAESTLPHDEREGVLWVGRLDREQKRPHLFLDIAEALPTVSFELVDPDGEEPEYNERIRSRAADLDNVTDHGSVEPTDVHAFYRDAAALVNTSAFEGFPSTFLEAWRYDTPVLSLAVPPSRYATETADACYAHEDVGELTRLVRDAATDSSVRAELSEPTHRYFLEHLTLSAVVDRYRNLFEDCL